MGQRGDEAPVVALIEEPAGLLPREHVGAEDGAVFLHRDRPLNLARCYPRLGRKPFERPDRAVVAQHDGLWGKQVAERIEDHRFEPGHTGGIQLDHQDRPEPVDDEAGQPVGFGMSEPIIRRREQPLAQLERALEPTGKKATADRSGRVAVEKPRREQGMRVEHRDPERTVVGPPQGHQGAGDQRFGHGIHPHLVRINPRIAAFGAPVPTRQQRDRGAGCRIVGGGFARRRCIRVHAGLCGLVECGRPPRLTPDPPCLAAPE